MKAFSSHVTTIGACLLGGLYPSLGQVPDQLKQSITGPAGVQSAAELGFSVAVDGGYAVAGAPLDDNSAQDSGVAKVFDTASGALLFVIPNPNPATLDKFGRSVAISGTRVVIGARVGGSPGGRAYVYDLGSGTPTAPIFTLSNPNQSASNSAFGYAVAISGMRVVVGAPNDLSFAGSAHVYDLGSATPTIPTDTLTNPGSDGSFGSSVAISNTRIVVAASGSEKVYVYDLVGGTPTVPFATLSNPHSPPGDEFGRSVTIVGNHIAVGAPSDIIAGESGRGTVYVYDLASNTPTVPAMALHKPEGGIYGEGLGFGNSVAMSGPRLVVGAHTNFGSDESDKAIGSAYIYDLGSATPTVPLAKLNNPNPATSFYFGYSVAISGTHVVVGVPGDTKATFAGAAYLFDLTAGPPTAPLFAFKDPGPAMGDQFGSSVAISGSLMVVGAPFAPPVKDTGSAYVYDLSNGSNLPVATLNNPGPSNVVFNSSVTLPTIDYFGASVAISGTRVVVGARLDGRFENGSAYIYDLSSGTPTLPVITLVNSGASPSDDEFGTSVGISGSRVVVGAPHDGPGSAYVYDVSSGTPTVPIATLHDPHAASNDFFGYSVAIAGSRIVVGAPQDDTGAVSAGRAYAYDLAGATPTVPVVTLNNPDPMSGDTFGRSLATSGTRIVIGASRANNPGNTYTGIAYVYDLSTASPNVPVVTLHSPNAAGEDNFAYSVAISGTRIVVGASGDDMAASDAGIAYVYDLSSGTPAVPVATLKNPSAQDDDYFGSSVAIDGATIAVGTPYDDSVGGDKGAAYVFGPSSYSIWKATQAGDQFASDLGNIDGDGLVNLAEYGLVRSPTMIDAAANETEVFAYAEGQRLRLFLTRDPARNDITIEVQAAGNVAGPWMAVATSASGAPFTGIGYVNGDGAGPGLKTVEVRDSVNVSDAPERFLRVRVTH